MNIKKIDIDKLKASSYNPRKDLISSDAEYQKIKKSIETFGYIDPAIVNKDMTVIGGHQRIKVLKDLGYTEIDCVITDIDKTQEKALNIALNKISGEWDMSALKNLLQELDTGEIDVLLTGFDFDEIEKLMTQFCTDDDYGTEFSLPDGDKSPFQQITFTLADFQAEFIKEKLKEAKENNDIETFGNENSNGNALFRMVKEWAELKI